MAKPRAELGADGSKESVEKQRIKRLKEAFAERTVIAADGKGGKEVRTARWTEKLNAKPVFEQWKKFKGVADEQIGEKLGTFLDFVHARLDDILKGDRIKPVREEAAAREKWERAKQEVEDKAEAVSKKFSAKDPHWRLKPSPDSGVLGSEEYKAYKAAKLQEDIAKGAYGAAYEKFNEEAKGKLADLRKEYGEIEQRMDAIAYARRGADLKDTPEEFEKWKEMWQSVMDDGLLPGADMGDALQLAGIKPEAGASPEKKPAGEPSSDPKPAETDPKDAKKIAATIAEAMGTAAFSKEELEKLERWAAAPENLEKARELALKCEEYQKRIAEAATPEEARNLRMEYHLNVLKPLAELHVAADPKAAAERDRSREELEAQIDRLTADLTQLSADYLSYPHNHDTLERLMPIGNKIGELTLKRDALITELKEKYGVDWPLETPVIGQILKRAGVEMDEEQMKTLPRKELIRIVKEATEKARVKERLDGRKKAEGGSAEPEEDMATKNKRETFVKEASEYREKLFSKNPEGGRGKAEFRKFLSSIEENEKSPEKAANFFAKFIMDEPEDGAGKALRRRELEKAILERIRKQGGKIQEGLKDAALSMPQIMEKHNKDIKDDSRFVFNEKAIKRAKQLKKYAQTFTWV